MKIDKLMTDDAILVELGVRLAQHRIALDMPQAELAAQAGVSKRTVERAEAGATTQMPTVIRTSNPSEVLFLSPPATV